MSKELTVEELRERPDALIDAIEPTPRQRVSVIPHNPVLRLRDFEPGAPLRDTGAVEWLIGERERERSGKKRS
ncbi:MAG TPA: hypothetical protein VGD79_03840 [Thermoanaerobaculia bacterium]|jgi:hypothetical protein